MREVENRYDDEIIVRYYARTADDTTMSMSLMPDDNMMIHVTRCYYSLMPPYVTDGCLRAVFFDA